VRRLALPFLPNRSREEDVPGSAQPPSRRCCPAPPLPSPNRRPRSASPRGSTALQLLAETDAEAHRSASGRKGGARASHRAVGEPIAACRDGVVGEPPRSTLRQARQASRSCFVSPGDETADFRGGEALIEAVPEDVLVISERAFDAGPPQGAIEAPAAVPHVRSRANLRYKSCPRSPPRRGRNAIEQVLRIPTDFARVATRYDRVAAPRLAAVRSRGSTEGHIAAVVALWL
jgi:hypothetical protein